MSLTLTLERGGGEVSGSGTNIELDGTIAGGAIESVEMYGDTEQTTYSGKNLLPPIADGTYTRNGVTLTVSNGIMSLSGTCTGASEWYITLSQDVVLPASTYTRSENRSQSVYLNTNLSTGGASWLFNVGYSGNARTQTLSASTTIHFYVLNIVNGVNYSGLTIQPQLEAGSTATSFEPYVGGVPSPNPDYPQEVQTVTGEQTITISDGNGQSQSYSVNLGDIELCKIGTYQDYIYKSGNDWYIHKEVGKITLDGTENWEAYGTIAQGIEWDNSTISTLSYQSNERPQLYSNYFIGVPRYNMFKSEVSFGISVNTTSVFLRIDTLSSLSDYTSWMASNNPCLYYVLATATETQITDSALIGQLDALNAAQTYDGTTVITASSENLAGSLEVTVATNIAKTYTEAELGAPLTISDVEGKSQNTTLNGNIYVDFVYNKKSFTVDIFNLTPSDYATIRAFYDSQFTSGNFPTISIPELGISNMVVFFEISNRNIVNQCLLTDKLTLKFRETVQP